MLKTELKVNPERWNKTDNKKNRAIQKYGNDNSMRNSKRDTDIQNSLLDSVEEGEGGMIWKNGIETCIISYMK